MSAVRLEGIAKRFGDTVVVRDVSLTVADGELVALLGPSGSGKTTLLRLVAGFESPDAGRIILGDRDVTAQDALGRRCGMVFQHYALFPHLTVAGNVAYGLAGSGLDRAQVEARVAEVLALVALDGLGGRPVAALSGGQQQRVALARALAPRPAVLLLDEPLSNLDPSLRERTRGELRELVRRIGITTVLVTHEQEEAFDLADRIALLLEGRLEQVATPEALYGAPASEAVARFIGRATTVPGTVRVRDEDGVEVEALGARLRATGTAAEGEAVRLLLRPEALRLDAEGTIEATIVARRFVGASDLVRATVGDHTVELLTAPMATAAGTRVRLAPTGRGAHAFPDRS